MEDKFKRNMMMAGFGLLSLIGGLGMKWLNDQKDRERTESIIRDQVDKSTKQYLAKKDK